MNGEPLPWISMLADPKGQGGAEIVCLACADRSDPKARALIDPVDARNERTVEQRFADFTRAHAACGRAAS